MSKLKVVYRFIGILVGCCLGCEVIKEGKKCAWCSALRKKGGWDGSRADRQIDNLPECRRNADLFWAMCICLRVRWEAGGRTELSPS